MKYLALLLLVGCQSSTDPRIVRFSGITGVAGAMKTCIEGHVYYILDRSIAPKLTDDGKPEKCQ